MDSILMQKLQAIKKSNNSKKQQLQDKFFQFTFMAITCSSSVPGDSYYDEYVDRSPRIRNPSTMEVKKVKKLKPAEENMERGRLVLEIVEVKKEKIDLQGEHELVLPTEELKKRADDLIARVNRQRRSELKLHYDGERVFG